jgi:hypothetical protein
MMLTQVARRTTGDDLWRVTRRAGEHYTEDNLSTRRGLVHSIETPKRDGKILRDVFFHSVALAILVGILVLLQAYVL